jgi:hypothetical protein
MVLNIFEQKATNFEPELYWQNLPQWQNRSEVYFFALGL